MKNGLLINVQNVFVKMDMSIVQPYNVLVILIAAICINQKTNVVLFVEVKLMFCCWNVSYSIIVFFRSGCLSERFHVQHMNSTWVESNGCMKCWCEDGRSRCVVEGCIAPPCENPRQIANVCCPVCMTEERTIDSATSNQIENACPNLDHCRLSCSNGYLRDQNGCSLCNCSIPIQFQIDQCPTLICDKHCPYSFSIDDHTGCPLCQCNPCPPLHCLKNCTYGLKKNEIGCPLCICESQLNTNSHLQLGNWPRHCQSGLLSYSNGEIWFDGCRQCLCYKGQTYCTLISCPVLKCTQPIFLTNRCCPTCPGELKKESC